MSPILQRMIVLQQNLETDNTASTKELNDITIL
jgi:hypothetical protein